MAITIDGKKIADELLAQVAQGVATLQRKHKVTPTLAVVLVGNDPASAVYVSNKIKRAAEAGIESQQYLLPASSSQAELEALVHRLNDDDAVHGILVQLPLPEHLSEARIIEQIAPVKDVDGFHPANVGALATGGEAFVPCTPLGCMIILQQHLGDLTGKHAIVIGRSNIVGKPMARLLLQAHCSVSVVHSRSQNAAALARQADIVIAAVGQPEMINAQWIKPGAVVIDVGINAVMVDGRRRLVGDVDFAAVADKASAITPVPGGVGPMTIACLMRNTLTACAQQLTK